MILIINNYYNNKRAKNKTNETLNTNNTNYTDNINNNNYNNNKIKILIKIFFQFRINNEYYVKKK